MEGPNTQISRSLYIIYRLGRSLLNVSKSLGEATRLAIDTFKWTFSKPFDVQNVVNQMIIIGVRSLPVTSLTALFTGMVLALQSGYSSMNIFNEPLYVGTVVGFSIIKELGPVLTAVVVSGRVGAAITAELGSMKVTEQIDALYTLGTNPIKYLAVPRFLACILLLPILTMFSNFCGIFGGLVLSMLKLKIPYTIYRDDILNFMEIDDLFHGLIKSVFFAFIIVLVSCYKGFSTKGGAEGVGRSTTEAVVTSMVLILVSDYFISSVLVAFRIG